MNVTVTYIDPDKLLHAVTVQNVENQKTGEALAQQHFETICEAEGWNIAEFAIKSVQTSDSPEYHAYLAELKAGKVAVDPRD